MFKQMVTHNNNFSMVYMSNSRVDKSINWIEFLK